VARGGGDDRKTSGAFEPWRSDWVGRRVPKKWRALKKIEVEFGGGRRDERGMAVAGRWRHCVAVGEPCIWEETGLAATRKGGGGGAFFPGRRTLRGKISVTLFHWPSAREGRLFHRGTSGGRGGTSSPTLSLGLKLVGEKGRGERTRSRWEKPIFSLLSQLEASATSLESRIYRRAVAVGVFVVCRRKRNKQGRSQLRRVERGKLHDRPKEGGPCALIGKRRRREFASQDGWEHSIQFRRSVTLLREKRLLILNF